tara:strand:+ start:533 stop:721 length:189 start_codon:yes stop_codon:yes gene_type:complete
MYQYKPKNKKFKWELNPNGRVFVRQKTGPKPKNTYPWCEDIWDYMNDVSGFFENKLFYSVKK